jgi:hypothetical protein
MNAALNARGRRATGRQRREVIQGSMNKGISIQRVNSDDA